MASLFEPFSLKSVTLRNRIAVSPMCQYMARDGVVTDWHRAHYATLARGGAGLLVVEASAVSPEGRITWGDLGLWNEEQAEALRPIVADIKAGGAIPGIQIAHAGRKASANRPWEGDDHLPENDPHGWATIAASAVPFGGGLPRVPAAMTLDDIARVQNDFVETAKRALSAGFEWLELHLAHGYLAQSFLSPHANKRDDQYGGSAENRGRFLLETVRAVRKVWPADLPLTARLGVIEFDGNDEQTVAEAIELVKRMKAEGLDFLDVSIGFNTPDAKIPWGPHFMADIAARVRQETGLPVGTSWFISEPAEADALVREQKVDLVFLGRPLLANPHWPYRAAKELEIKDPAWVLPPPYAHWLARYR
ncbi:NADH:flavin oxidoreductase/NADH oxidase [Rhizosaccharibacter radicis]|uniref:NADH:flavin oxidoreductase/NADH oxidase n=1 Tax=Rhizosaccharibacter radicis TaxID=2782605 RepID=A0ABT1VZ21_9PROT|nr:NADH:flavin oxidoreductase/NADH oxidase [Acetobacteraceae bacterium KSS12]